MNIKSSSIFIIFIAIFICCNHIYSQDNTFVKVITTKDEIYLPDVNIIAFPDLGIYMLAGNQLYPLADDDTISSITFPENMFVENVIWSGNDWVVKSRFEVYKMADYSEPAMSFNGEFYSIYPWDTTKIYITIQHSDSSSLFLGRLDKGKVSRLLTIKEHIIYVAAVDKGTLVVTTENIYLFEDKKCIRYLNFWAPVHTAVMTNKGLLFATDEEICLLKDIDTFATLFEGSCLKLLYDYKYLYILTSDYDLYGIDFSQL